MALTSQQYSEHLKKFLDEELFQGGDGDGDGASRDVGNADLGNEELLALAPGGLQDLEEELDQFRDHDVIKGILDQGCELREYARDVEDKLRLVELESIQDYIQESDNLVALHDQIQECDGILETMEQLLGKFQTDLGTVSEEIKQLQTQSQTMSVKLKNRRAAEDQLGAFMSKMSVSTSLIDGVLDAEVNEDYIEYLLMLHQHVNFVRKDEMAKTSAAYQDVEPVVEKLRIKAVAKVREFLLQKIYQLRRPRTNIQIIQHNVLLRFKYFVAFLRDHGGEVYSEVRLEYIKTLSKVLSQHFRSYLTDIEKMQTSVANRSDVLGADESSVALGITSLFSGKGPQKARSDMVFDLGDRTSVLVNLEKQALVPHVAEYEGKKFPYEVMFRNVHKLLMDTATTEYLFCCDFFGEDTVFQELFAPIIGVVEGDFTDVVQDCHDIICLMLMIRINHEHRRIMNRRRVPSLDDYLDRINMVLWPRFKALFDTQLASIQGGNERALSTNSPLVHAVTRRYASLVSSMMVLTTGYDEEEEGSFQVSGFDHMLDRLRSAYCDLLMRISNQFKDKRSGTIFLVVNYAHVVTTFKSAAINIPIMRGEQPSSPKSQNLGKFGNIAIKEFEEHLLNCTNMYVEDQLNQHFKNLIEFVKAAEAAQKQFSVPEGSAIPGHGPEQVAPILKDFSNRWTSVIEVMNKEVQMHFAEASCGKDVLQASMTQLLLFYTRLLELVKKQGPQGNALIRDAVNIPSIMYEIKRYTRS
ncbi:hypothetical protein BSKO_13356 [Bryopsis sp. KO-2023]|nr:hypothetical protein BSKO_13356 [Bryopsis sp. KO-2023]